MNSEIRQAADGLFFISESDHPLEYISLEKGKDPEIQLRSLSSDRNGKLETQTLEYFFRNMMKEREGEDPAIARRFQQLKKVLEKNLADIQVYRFGEIDIDAYIIGKLPDGTYAGLRTKQIET